MLHLAASHLLNSRTEDLIYLCHTCGVAVWQSLTAAVAAAAAQLVNINAGWRGDGDWS